jgi:hypothetical protein
MPLQTSLHSIIIDSKNFKEMIRRYDNVLLGQEYRTLRGAVIEAYRAAADKTRKIVSDRLRL